MITSFLRRAISYIPHQFTEAEAAKRFSAEDQKRLFAPLAKIDQTEGLTLYSNPIKKVLIPMIDLKAKIRKTDFEGRYGTTHYSTHVDAQGKAHVRSYTVWHHISGTLGSHFFRTAMYGGLKWDADLMEEAMEGFDKHAELKPFDLKSCDAIVDPFVIRSEFAQEIGTERLIQEEKNRADKYINHKVWCQNTDVQRVDPDLAELKLSSFLLPAYILHYENTPPRIMPAFDHEVKVVGPAPLSIAKVMSATGVAAAVATLFFPHAALAMRAASVLISTLAGGFFAQFKLGLQYHQQQWRMERKAQENARVSESPADKRRFLETGGRASDPEFAIPYRYLQALGLEPNQTITVEMINKAFTEKIPLVHPDHNKESGSAEQTRLLYEAKKVALEAVKRSKS